MSVAKRPRRRQVDVPSATSSSTHTHARAPKRLKTVNGAHASAGLGFLVNEDARVGTKLEARLTNGVPRSKNSRIDESRAVIAHTAQDDDDDQGEGGDSEEDDSDAEGGADDQLLEPMVDQKKRMVNGHSSGGDKDSLALALTGDAHDREDASERGEMSFGEILQTRHPDPINVAASLPSLLPDRHALVPTSGSQALVLPNGMSLGTVLTQALKTNDKDLLESCLQINEVDSIRATIQRLPSQYIATLLQRLAERLHRRPGRIGSLMVWVQWSLIAHGGYLAGQPELAKQLRSLAQVVRERAKGLQPLLHLKGKLDMLSAQLELRRDAHQHLQALNASGLTNSENVAYVEGDREDWSDSDEESDDAYLQNGVLESIRHLGPKDRRRALGGDEDSDLEDHIPNGITQDEDDGISGDEGEDDGEGMLDVEAEETSDDEDEGAADSEEEDDSDVRSTDSSIPSGDESDASGVKEPNPQTLNRKR